MIRKWVTFLVCQLVLMFSSAHYGESAFLNQSEIVQLQEKAKLQIIQLSLQPENMTIFSLLQINTTRVSKENFSLIQNMFNTTARRLFFDSIAVSEMASMINVSLVVAKQKSSVQLFQEFYVVMEKGTTATRIPIVYASFLKGISISELSSYNIIELAVKASGIGESVIKKLHRISDKDFKNAKALTFGQLPMYVNASMGVDSKLKHYYTLSFDSIAEAMLIHRNVAEGTKDFVKDFGFIARNLTFGQIKQVYNLTHHSIISESLASLGFVISDINLTLFKSVMNSTSNYILNETTIKEITTMLALNQSSTDSLTMMQLLGLFAKQARTGVAKSKLPVVYAAYLKGISVAQLVSYNIIELAVEITGLPEAFIRELHRISDKDFQNAKALTFGQLPMYVNASMGVDSKLKHYYTLSFDSIAEAMLIHKNVTEGTKDFVKDFGFIARNLTFGQIKQVYNLTHHSIISESLASLGFVISDINLTLFKSVMNSTSNYILNETTIKEITTMLALNQSSTESLTMMQLLGLFAKQARTGVAKSKLPVVYAAYLKGISVAQLVSYNIIELAVKITGLSEAFIRELHRISDKDFQNAKALTFGQLPMYVNASMGVDSKLKHYYTLSFDSIAEAMLIHKNVTEGTKDFVKDFGFIARNLTFGQIKQVYNLTHHSIISESLASLGFVISDINLTLFKSVMNSTSNYILNETTIKEITTMLALNQSSTDSLTMMQLLGLFAKQARTGVAKSKLPVVYAAYLKGISVAQLVSYNIIELAVKITGLPEAFIRELHRISDKDFQNAKALTFGQLPMYVNASMGVDSKLKHYYTLSFDSIAEAMLIHKNVTEGTKDFVKDFGFIARNLTFGQIKQVYNLTHHSIISESLASLGFVISDINLTLFKSVMNSTSNYILNETTIKEITTMLALNQSSTDSLTMMQLLGLFAKQARTGVAKSKLPVVYAAYLKGISVAQLVSYNIIELAVKITGLPEAFIRELHRISDKDFQNAKALTFGQLPMYVNASMGVDSKLKHYYTLSFDSIAEAMLIHKNVTEGTKDFVKDFGFIARNLTFGQIKQVYNLTHHSIISESLASLGFVISDINLTLFKSVMNSTSNYILNETTIKEITTMLALNQSSTDSLTMMQLLGLFAKQARTGVAKSKLPVVYAAYLKGISVAQLVSYNIIELAVKITGLPEAFIRELHRISDKDFQNAKALTFGQLPMYVNASMGVDSKLKHYYTLSFDSIAEAMLIHKNVTEGTKDFVKDFGFIARNLTFGQIKQVYNLTHHSIISESLASLGFVISDINLTLFKSVMNSTSNYILNETTIKEITTMLALNQSSTDSLTMMQLLGLFAKQARTGVAKSKLPVVYAAYLKGISVAQLVSYNIIELAVKITGLPEAFIRELHRISDKDFQNAMALTFGQLPMYVNASMGVDSKLKHYYTLSFDSIAEAMLIHKNVTEGTKDFVKDFGFIARNLTFGQIKQVYNLTHHSIISESLASLGFVISDINLTLFKSVMNSTSNYILNETSIKEITTMLALNQSSTDSLTMMQLLGLFAKQARTGVAKSKLPVLYAAYLKGISVAQLVSYNIIELAVKITGLPEAFIRELHRISDKDFQNAKALTFGQLPMYVNASMGVDSKLKHYYTLSFDSIAEAMLIHKNVTEGTKDFVKDFGFIARNLTFGQIKQVYNLTHQSIISESLANLGFVISDINLTLFKSVMNSTSNYILNETTIKEMTTMLALNQSSTDSLTMMQLLGLFAKQARTGVAKSKLPVVYAAYLKGISVAQLESYNIIELAVKITGLPEAFIRELHRISDKDFQNAKALTFGQLPMYVNASMGVDSKLKHYYTLSFDSIAEAMLIHKNVTEGTKDFVKDFGFIARNLTFGQIKQVYNLTHHSIISESLASLGFVISDINLTLFKSVMNSTSNYILNETTIKEMTTMLALNQSSTDSLTMMQLLGLFAKQARTGVAKSKLPVVYAAYLKGISVAQLESYNIIELAVKITGLPEAFIRELHRISDKDFQNAKALTFGQLPMYVNASMGVDSKLKHYYTLSFDSIAEAMLIHKNVTEGTKDFVKDFGFIARNLTFGQIKQVYNLTHHSIISESLASLGFVISDINLTLFKSVMNSTSNYILNETTIKEITTMLALNQSSTDSLTMMQLLGLFAKQARTGVAKSKLPVVYAAYLKGISVAQLVSYNIIELAVKITGLPEAFIRELHRISDKDFQNAKALTFGQLPMYVNASMGVDSKLKHYYTLSFDSIAEAMLIHKNVTEGTKDFVKDFGFIARNLTFGQIKQVYNLTHHSIISESLASLGFVISDINLTLFKSVMNSTSNFILNQTLIGVAAVNLGLSQQGLHSLSMAQLLRSFSMKVAPGIAKSKLPISYAAFLRGIKISQLPAYNIIDLAVNISGLSEQTIMGVHGISVVDFQKAKLLPFGHLPAYVKQRIGMNKTLKHYYSMSFDSIAEAMLVHKSFAEATKDFVKDFQFITAEIKFHLLFQIFDISLAKMLSMSIPELVGEIADANATLVFGLLESDLRIVSSLTIHENLLILKSQDEKFDLSNSTINQLISTVITSAKQAPGYFMPLDKLKEADTMEGSLKDFIKLGNVSEIALKYLLRSNLISERYFKLIELLPVRVLLAKKIALLPPSTDASTVLIKVLLSIRNLKDFAKMPFVAAAYYNGVTVSSISTSSIIQIAEKVFGSNINTIVSELKLNYKVIGLIANSTFQELSDKIFYQTGRTIDYRQLYHIAFYDLLDAVLLRKNAVDTSKAITIAMRYIAQKMVLHELRNMFEMTHRELLNSSLIALSRKHSNVSVEDVSTALNLTVQQEHFLEKVRIVDAQLLLDLSYGIMSLTTEDIGHRIINLGNESVFLFTPMDELLRKKNLDISVLSSLSLTRFLALGSMQVAKINVLFGRMNLTKDTQDFINSHPLADFANVWKMSVAVFAKWDIIKLFWQLNALVNKEANACTKFTNPCPANSNCLDPIGNLYCRCSEGFSGNGTYCYDGCSKFSCGVGAACVNVPDAPISCRCIKPGHIAKKGKCTKQDGKIYMVSGLKLDQKYKESYKNKDSKEFQDKAAEIESVLHITVCQNIFGCIAIRVMALTKGSIVVDYSVTVESGYNNVTDKYVLEVSKNALKDDKMLVLGARKESSLSARKSNICELGGDDCSSNSKCKSIDDGSSYTCECNDGYKKEWNDCKKNNKVGLIVGVVVGALILLAMVVFVVVMKKKQRNAQLENRKMDIPFALFKGSRSSSTVDINTGNTGAENQRYESDKV